MERIRNQVQDLSSNRPNSEIKRQIYEKVRKRMAKLAKHTNSNASFCPELNPDVIVISDDQTMLFESQNERATTLLHQKFGGDIETMRVGERIRVHPSQCQKLIDALSVLGLNIAVDTAKRR